MTWFGMVKKTIEVRRREMKTPKEQFERYLELD
jgi:hypothetical protein